MFLFSGEFRGIMGEDVPYRKLGFPSLNAFIETIPDTIRIGRLVLSRQVDIVSQKITWCLKYNLRGKDRTCPGANPVVAG